MRSRSVLPSLAGLLGALVCTGIASAAVSQASSGPRASLALSPHWTKISRDVGLGFASAGLLRTSDGRLHVIWPDDVANKYSLHYSTVGGNKLLATGTVVNSWAAMTSFPRLVPAPHGTGKPDLRVIFDGANGHIGSPYNLNTVYAATSSFSGTSWSLDPGSLSHSQLVPLTDDAATAEANGQPIAAWSSQRSVSYHVGIDPNTPAKTADTTIPVGADGAVIDPTLETDSSGRVWGAWFNSSFTSTMGYWADPILTGKSAMKKAPGSGGTNLNNANRSSRLRSRLGRAGATTWPTAFPRRRSPAAASRFGASARRPPQRCPARPAGSRERWRSPPHRAAICGSRGSTSTPTRSTSCARMLLRRSSVRLRRSARRPTSPSSSASSWRAAAGRSTS